MTRVLILVENLSVPFDRRVWQESTALRDAGYDVSVVCPMGTTTDTAADEVVDGVRILRYPLRPAAGGPAGYLREYGVALWRTLQLARRVRRAGRVDVVQACHPPHLRPARPAVGIQHRPGRSLWLDVRLYGRSETLLTHLPPFPEGWWFLRYPDPEPHLRLRIRLRDTAHFADVARDLALWAERSHKVGLPADYTLGTYRPETRYGSGPTLAAAEAVFAADSRAALRRLLGDRQAATAAGMITIVRGFSDAGARWLVDRVPHRSGPRLDPVQLALARQTREDDGLAAALAAYRTLADREGLNTDQVLSDLLHLHHARMIGVELVSERHCLRLARAVVHTDLIRGTS